MQSKSQIKCDFALPVSLLLLSLVAINTIFVLVTFNLFLVEISSSWITEMFGSTGMFEMISSFDTCSVLTTTGAAVIVTVRSSQNSAITSTTFKFELASYSDFELSLSAKLLKMTSFFDILSGAVVGTATVLL